MNHSDRYRRAADYLRSRFNFIDLTNYLAKQFQTFKTFKVEDSNDRMFGPIGVKLQSGVEIFVDTKQATRLVYRTTQDPPDRKEVWENAEIDKFAAVLIYGDLIPPTLEDLEPVHKKFVAFCEEHFDLRTPQTEFTAYIARSAGAESAPKPTLAEAVQNLLRELRTKPTGGQPVGYVKATSYRQANANCEAAQLADSPSAEWTAAGTFDWKGNFVPNAQPATAAQ